MAYHEHNTTTVLPHGKLILPVDHRNHNHQQVVHQHVYSENRVVTTISPMMRYSWTDYITKFFYTCHTFFCLHLS